MLIYCYYSDIHVAVDILYSFVSTPNSLTYELLKCLIISRESDTAELAEAADAKPNSPRTLPVHRISRKKPDYPRSPLHKLRDREPSLSVKRRQRPPVRHSELFSWTVRLVKTLFADFIRSAYNDCHYRVPARELHIPLWSRSHNTLSAGFRNHFCVRPLLMCL